MNLSMLRRSFYVAFFLLAPAILPSNALANQECELDVKIRSGPMRIQLIGFTTWVTIKNIGNLTFPGGNLTIQIDAPHGTFGSKTYAIPRINPGEEWESEKRGVTPQEGGLHTVRVTIECNETITLYVYGEKVDSAYAVEDNRIFFVHHFWEVIVGVVAIIGVVIAIIRLTKKSE